MSKEIRLKIDAYKTRTKYIELFHEYINKSTAIWHGVLRLIITLSSSLLVVTLAVIEKLFSVNEMPKLLILSWVSLFASIIFGIFAEINESIFFADEAKNIEEDINTLDEKIGHGMSTYESSKRPSITYGSIKFGGVSIYLFMVAVLCLCLAFFSKIESSNIVPCIVFPLGMFFFSYMAYYLSKKLKRQPATLCLFWGSIFISVKKCF